MNVSRVARYGDKDGLAFVLLCTCVAAQGYALPLWPIGPSWAVWPTLPVVTAVALIGVCILRWQPVWLPIRAIVRGYTLLVLACLLSFTLVTVLSRDLLLPDANLNFGFPIYQIWIILLGGGCLWAASTIHFDERRIRILRRVTLLTLLWIGVTVCLTYQNFVPTRLFAPQIPTDPNVSGPYFRYLANWEGVGLGTIGYNHAYAASLILILAALWMQLLPKGRHVFSWAVVLSLALLVVFLTGSRAGFAGFAVFVVLAALEARRISGLFLLMAAIPLVVLAVMAAGVDLQDLIERQGTLLESPTTETLSDRDLIWQQRIEFLGEDNVRWLIGTGFGSANASGDNAHMLYLHIIVEMGILGLVACGAFFSYLLRRVWQRVPAPRYLFAASLCILFSSVTQETLYPVPAMGFTLPLYLMTVAIVLKARHRVGRRPVEVSPTAPWSPE